MHLFQGGMPAQSSFRDAITKAYDVDEASQVQFLLSQLSFSDAQQKEIQAIAADLVNRVRSGKNEQTSVEALMMQYDLSSEEGTVLMCLAEALLRIPDKETEELLIRDKLTSANWEKHIGASASTFVNLTTRSLAIGGKILDDHSEKNAFKRIWYGLLNRTGEPLIREAVRRSMKIMSEHFVLGRTIDEAIKNGKPFTKKGYLFSFDMLGEMAKTEMQADHYFVAYQHAISVMGESSAVSKGFLSPSISIKLSALHPRYETIKSETVVPFLADRLKTLALQAKKAGIYVTVDAEESYRLDLSLDIFEKVFADSELSGWPGLGLAVQAYQKRGYAVLNYLIDLSKRYRKKISVRLVKGAYWDTEIKLAQVGGYASYPVFTRKVSTDVSYLACARLLLSAQDAIYPQFATHNAYTVAAILWMTKNKSYDFEFQNLQGMGKPLHNVLVSSEDYHAASRIYAPVGQYQDLLPYLVRRLLENGANTSFVHQITNPVIPIEKLVSSPIDQVRNFAIIPNPHIPSPKAIYPEGRINSSGLDVSNYHALSQLTQALKKYAQMQWSAAPFSRVICGENVKRYVNPNDANDVVGSVQMATAEDAETALLNAEQIFPVWTNTAVDARAVILEKTADLMQSNQVELFALLIREAGKTLFDAIAEVREAIDFCRYYAKMARSLFAEMVMPGPVGESNTLRLHGLGTMICVSPWNFPLAIFTGQIAASLASGNCVIAKPAGQTCLIAARAIDLFYEAGLPKEVLQLMPGSGRVIGNALIASEKSQGVLFTGSTETAKDIQKTLAQKKGAIVPFIAETGGINAMIVDSSALLEQVVQDAMVSAFGSAGQRCSALRVLFVQEDIADAFLEMLAGAMKTWSVGNTSELSHDVGPLIDVDAQKTIRAHLAEMNQKARFIAEIPLHARLSQGNFVAPTVFELPDLSLLQKEVFGPVLHVIRFQRKRLDDVIDAINALGYGLTLGIQSRIDETIMQIVTRMKVGNIYVNRTMIGAVVGVQPFGGCGLSGTGPKAGGPHYLLRLCRESTLTINTAAVGGDTKLLSLDDD